MRRAALFLCASLLAAPAVQAAVAEIKYTGKTMRDPFMDAAEVKTAVDESAAMQQSVSAMTLQGILYNMDNPVAIIDGKFYRVGSRLGAGQVTRIEREGVTVSQGGKQFTIKQSRGKTK